MIECFTPKRFNESSRLVIKAANTIIDEYNKIGLSLTLRQLYYQFVARDLLANKHSNYKRLGNIINDARLAGEVDWNAIEDRTRNLAARSHWENPKQIIDETAQAYFIDLWKDQEYRLEVWIEKDAGTGVIAGTCSQYDVPYFSSRGYTSQSEQYNASQRFKHYLAEGQQPVILHIGDHDPSGLDMTRDNDDRLNDVFGVDVKIDRLALNMDQVRRYRPPPNPAKETDIRFKEYRRKFGRQSWELDALDPRVLQGIVEKAIQKYMNATRFNKRIAKLKRERGVIAKLAKKLKG